MDIFEKCYQRYIQDEVREQGVYPYFHALESRQDTEVIMEGKRRIMLGSNNYLGLTTNSSVIEAGVQAYRTLGSGCSGSRFLNGTLKLHLELEDELAKFLRKDAVVTFSTGFQSNLGIISSIVGLHDYVIMDRENHASLYDGCKLSYGKMLRYQHNDMADLEKKLQKAENAREQAEAAAKAAEDKLENAAADVAKERDGLKLELQEARRKLEMSDVTVAQFKIVFDTVQGNLNDMLALIAKASGENQTKLRAAAEKLIDAFKGRIES